MDQLQNLTSDEVQSLCLLIAMVALFLAIILTIIHYLTGTLAGFIGGVVVGTHGYWPMMQEWARDVLIPVVIGALSLLVWGGAQLWERFLASGVGEAMQRF